MRRWRNYKKLTFSSRPATVLHKVVIMSMKAFWCADIICMFVWSVFAIDVCEMGAGVEGPEAEEVGIEGAEEGGGLEEKREGLVELCGPREFF